MPADGWYNYIDFLGRTVVFPAPTDATNEMLRAIREEVDALYIEGTRYRKTGIVFFGLEKPGTPRQMDLFENTDSPFPIPRSPSSLFPVPSSLYKAVDALNARYGKGKVFSARRVRFPTGREPPQGAVTPRDSAYGRGT